MHQIAGALINDHELEVDDDVKNSKVVEDISVVRIAELVKFFFMYQYSLQLNSDVNNQMSWIINVKELRHNDRFDSKKVSESQRD